MKECLFCKKEIVGTAEKVVHDATVEPDKQDALGWSHPLCAREVAIIQLSQQLKTSNELCRAHEHMIASLIEAAGGGLVVMKAHKDRATSTENQFEIERLTPEAWYVKRKGLKIVLPTPEGP